MKLYNLRYYYDGFTPESSVLRLHGDEGYFRHEDNIFASSSSHISSVAMRFIKDNYSEFEVDSSFKLSVVDARYGYCVNIKHKNLHGIDLEDSIHFIECNFEVDVY